MFDLLVTGGHVYDGSGREPFRADVGVVGGHIAAVGRLDGAEARRTISAVGMAVTPGFIDTHSHADLNLLVQPDAAPKVRQGVTTEVVGQCGLGPAPIAPAQAPAWRRTLTGVLGDKPADWAWTSFAAYLAELEAARPALNVAAMTTHGAIRASVLGLDDRAPGPTELAAMERLVDEALGDGAFGLSTGLVYLPCLFAEEQELVALYRRVAARGRLMMIHIRNQANQVLPALDEALTIAAKAGVTLHVSHLCAAGRPNWGAPRAMLAAIDAARARGQDVTFDQHPYDAGSTMLSQVLPPWAVAGGPEALTARLADRATRERIKREIAEDTPSPDPRMPTQNYAKLVGWENILITSVQGEANRACVGRTVAEIAADRGQDPADVALDLLAAEQGMVTMVMLNLYAAEDLATIMRHEAGMIGSDDIYTGTPHPRLYGTFPRVLSKFARADGVLSLAEAVRRMTAVPAKRLGLADRGVIREGAAADLVLFDPVTVHDRATYGQPRQYPIGIHYVVVNGQLVVDDGKQTTARPGRVLRPA